MSVGDLLREETENPRRRQELDLNDIMSKASLAPAPYVHSILSRSLSGFLEDGKSKFIIDGFPRTMQQAQIFEHEGSEARTLLCC